MGIKADTTMVKNLCDGIRSKVNPQNMLITFPECFDSLKTDDTQLEIIKSADCTNV